METNLGDFGKGIACWESIGNSQAGLHFAAANGFPVGAYDSFLAPLARQFSIIALENRGVWPRHPAPAPEFDWYDHAEDLIAFLDYQQKQGQARLPVTGMGHSIGATVTLMAAVKRPDIFSRIVLLDPASTLVFSHLDKKEFEQVHLAKLVSQTRNRKINWQSREEFRDYLPTRTAYKHFVETAFDDYASAGITASGDQFQLCYQPEWEAHNFAGTPSIDNELSRISVPTLLLCGEHSPMWPKTRLKDFSSGFSASVTVKTISDAGHLIPQENPRQTLLAIMKWLEGIG